MYMGPWVSASLGSLLGWDSADSNVLPTAKGASRQVSREYAVIRMTRSLDMQVFCAADFTHRFSTSHRIYAPNRTIPPIGPVVFLFMYKYLAWHIDSLADSYGTWVRHGIGRDVPDCQKPRTPTTALVTLQIYPSGIK